MKFSKGADILLNVVIPLIMGMLLYYFNKDLRLPGLVNNHIADGLWAYAFISSLLITWDRELNSLWISIAFIAAACFELLQYNFIIVGTGDIFDVITYYFFFFISLKLNYLFKLKLKPLS
jgi:hypothetical protein